MPDSAKVSALAAVLAARSVQHTGSSYRNGGRSRSWSLVPSCTGSAHKVYSWSASVSINLRWRTLFRHATTTLVIANFLLADTHPLLFFRPFALAQRC